MTDAEIITQQAAEIERLRDALSELLSATQEVGYVHYEPLRIKARAALESHND